MDDCGLASAVHEAVGQYAPLAEWIEHRLRDSVQTLVVGISGAQGTGKTTLAEFICATLRDRSSVVVSLDDFYLTRAERAALARDIHPLLITRGVPGTHDVELACRTLRSLQHLGPGEVLEAPRFDKASDDRVPESVWTRVEGPLDLIVFEGWCLGSEPQAEGDLANPVNELEAREDPDGTWRRYANDQLRDVYPPLFALVDALVVLTPPDFDAVLRWRGAQERELGEGTAVMGDAELRRFVQHFERITRHNAKSLPDKADVVLVLGDEHDVVSAVYNNGQ